MAQNTHATMDVLSFKFDTAALVSIIRPFEAGYPFWKAIMVTEKLVLVVARKLIRRLLPRVARALLMSLSLLVRYFLRFFFLSKLCALYQVPRWMKRRIPRQRARNHLPRARVVVVAALR